MTLAFLEPGPRCHRQRSGNQELDRRAADRAQHHQQRRDDGARVRHRARQQRLGRRPVRRHCLPGAHPERHQEQAAGGEDVCGDVAHRRRRYRHPARRSARRPSRPRTCGRSSRVSSRWAACSPRPTRRSPALLNSLQLSGSGQTVALSFAVPSEVFDMIPKYKGMDGEALHEHDLKPAPWAPAPPAPPAPPTPEK